ncbi:MULTISPECIES: NAD(P)H-dependent oxidoreductase [unclassified Dysgonomonas]|jgi:modulator of drug activity B|uniref:NAD(P)H-dependent oxidoreductase n=1 Tax=unclassified Dysgonomonas TaxID=2630389 RepID=UPI0025B91834|nr:MULTISPECIES: NAD(P)H-dependent oxidoreductase [unclassified Dysgonomonas]MDR2003424.1 NAD(P)H-dependent oxidoreductase [Prevotella sp.]HMM01357.1 NAD(P)H-dependent oxidoreductase [Dysgonomonas sp.]
MKKIFVINGAPKFAHSGGEFNKTLTNWTVDYFKNNKGYEVKTTDINDSYKPEEEVEKFVWADVIIYHTPIWWFQLPNDLKKYIDEVFTAGHQNGIYFSDGRRSANPTRNYGTGGLLQGRKYMLTTTWNAPVEAFTLEDEFFKQHSVDKGVMFGFHRMNAFIGLEPVDSFHFYDVMKNSNIKQSEKNYRAHLDMVSKEL